MINQDDKGSYTVKSSDGKSEYTVSITSEKCQLESDCVPHCKDSPCDYLCRHMIMCTCYDYQHGHLCKHAHEIYSMHTQMQAECSGISKVDNDCIHEDPRSIDIEADTVEMSERTVEMSEHPVEMSEVKCVGVKPSKSTQDKAGNLLNTK